MPVSAASRSGMMLYNGVELPNIDSVWTDKVTYSCATIWTYTGDTDLYLTNAAAYNAYVHNSGLGVAFYFPNNTNYVWYRLVDGVWTFHQSGTTSSMQLYSSFFWSNVDLLSSGGDSVFVEGSDPVDPNAPSFSVNLILRSVHALDNSVSILGAITDISDTSVPVSYTWSLYTGGSLVRTGAYDGTPSTGSTGLDIFSTIGDLDPETEYEITYEVTADGEPTGITASTSFTTLAGTGSGGGDVSDPDYSGQLNGIQQGIGEIQDSVDNVGSKVDDIQDTLTETKEEITSLPGKIASAIIDGIKSLFVPSEEDLTEIKDEYENMLSEKLGFVWQGFDLLTTFVGDLQTSLESGEAYEFNFPGVVLPMQGEEFVLVPEMPVSLDNELIDILRPLVGTVVSMIAVIAFVNMAHDYVLAIVSGVSVYQFERRKE